MKDREGKVPLDLASEDLEPAIMRLLQPVKD